MTTTNGPDCKHCGTTQAEQAEHGMGCCRCPCPHGHSQLTDDCPLCAAEQLAREEECEQYGHVLEDIGHAGPDSGCIHIVCTRCGFAYGRKWLY